MTVTARPRTGPVALTGKEQQVLSLSAEGKDERAIAQEMGIAPSTLLKHRAHLREKLGTTRPGAMLHTAYLTGILPAPRVQGREPERAALSAPGQLVLGVLADGCSVAAAAIRLRCATSAVSTQIESLYRELGAATAPQAIALAWRRGDLRKAS